MPASGKIATGVIRKSFGGSRYADSALRELSEQREPPVKDEEFIASVIKAREESVAYFSSASKPERERWFVHEFLNNLGLPHSEAEIVSCPDEPPDVFYANARFEVKEILDHGRRRHEEYKESLRQARQAKIPADLLEGYTPKDINYTEVCGLIGKNIVELRPYAPATQKVLDLLFYVNLEHVHGYVPGELPSPAEFKRYGWRSVSFVAGPMSVVLYAGVSAPSFLRGCEGKVAREPRRAESA